MGRVPSRVLAQKNMPSTSTSTRIVRVLYEYEYIACLIRGAVCRCSTHRVSQLNSSHKSTRASGSMAYSKRESDGIGVCGRSRPALYFTSSLSSCL